MNLFYGGWISGFHSDEYNEWMNEWAEIWGSYGGNDEEQQCYLIKILKWNIAAFLSIAPFVLVANY